MKIKSHTPKSLTLKDRMYLNAFLLIHPFSRIFFKTILSSFGSIEKAFEAPQDLWRKKLSEFSIKKETLDKFISEREKTCIKEEYEKLLHENIRLITFFDEEYPKDLSEILDAPFQLFVKGNIKNIDPALACVGSRKVTEYGKRCINTIIPPLANYNITVVSGLAYGVDQLCHQKTIESKGRTIAVLGGGVDEKSIYPRENANLAEKIIQNDGAVISEYPCGTIPFPHYFPLRNRIISGLSKAVLVIEGSAKSGSLITAYSGLDQGKDIFSIPHSIFSKLGEGPNSLLSKGAKLITSHRDIIEEFGIQERTRESIDETRFSNIQRKIIESLKSSSLTPDHLSKKTGKDVTEILSELSLLEMEKVIENAGGGKFCLR